MSDSFESAARAEAKRRNPPINRHPDDFTYPRSVLREHKRGEFEVGAEWARTYLAEQEPTEDDVQAAVAAILSLTDETEETARMDDIDVAWDHARAALIAARAVGRGAR